MPKVAIDYSRTVIYKLVCNDLNITDVYVGHSTNFQKRKAHHKDACNNPNDSHHHYKVYQCIKSNGGWNNWSMIMVEEFPCENRLQAESRERYYIETLRATLNCVIPTRTQKDYWHNYYKIINADEIKEKNKEYRLQNAEEIRKKNKEYKKINAEEISKKQKEYREKNKQKLNEKQRINYFLKKEENKDITEIEI